MQDRHNCPVSLAPWIAFVEVCRAGSLSGAAASLGYSQSAVSRQVMALEREIGVALLERLPRGVRPTPAGAAFLRHAQTVVSEVARAKVAAGIAASELYLSLGAVPSAMAGLVPRALVLAKAQLPAHRCTLRAGLSADLEEAVSAGVLDVAVVTDYPPGLTRNRHLQRTILVKDEMCVVLPPTHVLAAPDRGRLGLSELSEEIWAEDNAGSAAVLVQAAATAGFTPAIELEAGDLLGKVALWPRGSGWRSSHPCSSPRCDRTSPYDTSPIRPCDPCTPSRGAISTRQRQASRSSSMRYGRLRTDRER